MKNILLFFLFIGVSIHGQAQTCQAFYQYTQMDCPTIFFFDGSSASGRLDNWAWDFGDSNTSTMQNPNHTYASNGSYMVCFTISTNDNCSMQYCEEIQIICIQSSINSGFQHDVNTNCPTVDFTDQSTTMPGPITSWFWDFGDTNTSTMQNPEHTYLSNGTYTTSLTVTSAAGSDTSSETVMISCLQPAAIPTLSEWGMVVLSLLLLIGSIIGIGIVRKSHKIRVPYHN